MQLSYRGLSYTLPSTIAMSSGSVIGQYRGAVLRSLYPAQAIASLPSANLKYRGAYYQCEQVNFSDYDWMGGALPEMA